ncbi:hypothetical protein BWQ96_07139 [Gracilariopsis chorda]|uniref:Uncharacterized protein n=1 Tax=Gracilariopsis chorda TaxID=448386 RepID=A0A2V3ILZ0_9FLOR|nr:hypothetical protein BWQ96_07139 [Gracilariopsis chorda]|eukprot:PXF43105.1 hypothetical protein BWQ96_07139 [Gracilariopsis chorda]
MPTPVPSPPSAHWHEYRYFYFSDKAPISSVLNKVDGFVRNVDRVVENLEQIEKRILEEQVNLQIIRYLPGNSRTPICNLEDEAWRSAAKDQIRSIWNKSLAVTCVTDFVSEGAVEQELHNSVQELHRLLKQNASDIAREAKTNYTEPDTIFNYPFQTNTEDCVVNALGAYRNGSSWFLSVGITNWRKEKHLKDFRRQYLVELMGRGGKTGHMVLQNRSDDESDDSQAIPNATTLSVSHSGTAGPNLFKETFLEDNSGVKRALLKANLDSQQYTDAISPSSITILILPLFLNLLPVALFADVSRRGMLSYALLSDVLTTLPLGIKGVELILIGSSSHRGAVARITSHVNGKRPEVGAAEVFVAECRQKREVYPTGIAFLLSSLLFLIGGLVAEVAARSFKMRRKQI